MAKNMVDLELMGIYWKRGDDFARHLKEAEEAVVPAFRAWADELSSKAEMLRELAGVLEGHPCTGYGDTHHISISVPVQIVPEVIKNELVYTRTVKIVDAEAGYVSPSGAPVGALLGKTGEVIGDSPKYNSSFLVRIEGEVYDIHDQHFADA